MAGSHKLPFERPLSISATGATLPVCDEHNGTAFTAVADAGNGTVLAGGQRGLRDATATVARFDDGEAVWTTTLDGNASARVVDVADGEDEVSISLDSRRETYEVYVTADRRVGANPTRADLRAAFGDEPGFVGVESPGRRRI